jgi:hypothetical protein
MNASAFSEPFTPRGVASFARAKFSHLFLAQCIFAFIAALVVAWFFYVCCFPVVQKAVENLPSDGQIQSGKLAWGGPPFQTLAEGHFLAFDVDLYHSGQFRSTAADLQIEFGLGSVQVFSLFGYFEMSYPPNGFMQFNRPQLQPLWEAWRSIILFAIAAATFISLLLIWWILATLHFLLIWLTGFFTNRDLDVRMSWKLSGAALLPGAMLMILGIFLYGCGILNLISFLFVFGAHFVLGWLYLLFALPFFTRIPSATPKGNPFKPNGKSKS